MNTTNTHIIPEVNRVKIELAPLLRVSETSIIRVAELLKYPELRINDSILRDAEQKIFQEYETKDAFESLKKINFEKFQSSYFEMVYFLLEYADFEEDMVDYLYDMGMDVIHIEFGLSIPTILLKVGNVFYGPNIGTIELQPLETPFLQGQNTMYYSGLKVNGQSKLLSISPNFCALQEYYRDEKIVSGTRIQVIENTREEFDLLDTTQGILYNLSAVDIRGNSETIRFYLNQDKTIIIEFDGKVFSPVKQIDRSKKVDFSDIEEETYDIVKN